MKAKAASSQGCLYFYSISQFLLGGHTELPWLTASGRKDAERPLGELQNSQGQGTLGSSGPLKEKSEQGSLVRAAVPKSLLQEPPVGSNSQSGTKEHLPERGMMRNFLQNRKDIHILGTPIPRKPYVFPYTGAEIRAKYWHLPPPSV
jgi:hypothetical protein